MKHLTLVNWLKSVMELAMRMAEIVRSTSEWHRRMSSNRLSQNGKRINYEALTPGAKVSINPHQLKR
jgi:hypothetical protein